MFLTFKMLNEASEPNERFFRHVRIEPEDFLKPDAWEFYLTVKHWPEFQPGSVQKTHDERILRDVQIKEVELGRSSSVKCVQIWYEKGVEFDGLDWWLAHNTDKADQVKSIITLDQAIRKSIQDAYHAYKQIREYIDGVSDDFNSEIYYDFFEMLTLFSKATDMSPYREMLQQLLAKLKTLDEFTEISDVCTEFEKLLNSIYR